jgi:hypothetical protein
MDDGVVGSSSAAVENVGVRGYPKDLTPNFEKVFNYHPHNNYADILYHNGKRLVRTARTIEQFTNSK